MTMTMTMTPPPFFSPDGHWTDLRLATGVAPDIALVFDAAAAIVVRDGRITWVGDVAQPPIEGRRAADVPIPETLAGVTVPAACAFGLQETQDVIGVGLPANFVLWNVQNAAELAYEFGPRLVPAVVRQRRLA